MTASPRTPEQQVLLLMWPCQGRAYHYDISFLNEWIKPPTDVPWRTGSDCTEAYGDMRP